MDEWVEVRAKDVEEAVAHALRELGIASRDAVEIEVVEEPARGFLGVGSRDAVVRVKPRPKRRQRHRRQKGAGKESKAPAGGRKGKGRSQEGGRRSGAAKSDVKKEEGKTARQETKAKAGKPKGKPVPKKTPDAPRRQRSEEREKVNVEEQAGVVRDFLNGLLEAFGIDGIVDVKVDEDIIYADVGGGQSDALVGQKGAILQAVLELTRTVVQRKTQAGARLRVDIGGYVERRREALKIYAGRLAERVVAEGGEVMLEPMNPADRKVVHDAVAEVEGVRSFSEGEEPNRSVVIANDASA